MLFLQSRFAQVLSGVLALQAVVLYAAISRPETIPVVAPLNQFTNLFGSWRMVKDIPIEPEVQEVLKADDTLNRLYARPGGGVETNLFIAFFKTQRTGQSPHSPKNCLPGSGWEPIQTGLVTIPVADRSEPIVANRFVTAYGDEKDVTIYWYQSHSRIIASEYRAKFWLVADSIRYHRSDTALVRVIVPVVNNDVSGATATGIDFVQSLFPALSKQLPL
ncbi:MAG: EpsI family protein [Terriglobia bacterium]|nr:MAG: EpsI family protein [Terriglobia bacterium]